MKVRRTSLTEAPDKRTIDKRGYVHLRFGVGVWESEHRYVVECHIGRFLESGEHVHHINTSFIARSNNRIGNLKLVTPQRHSQIHNSGREHPPRQRALRDTVYFVDGMSAHVAPEIEPEPKVYVTKKPKRRTWRGGVPVRETMFLD